MIPEPMPYYPPGAIPPVSYHSVSYHRSSSSVAPSFSHRMTASSITGDDSSRLTQNLDGLRPTSSGVKTPISSCEYLRHPSTTSNLDVMHLKEMPMVTP